MYSVAGPGQSEVIASGKARNIATQTKAAASLAWKIRAQSGEEPVTSTHPAVAETILARLAGYHISIEAIGHRFVHGGDEFLQTSRIRPPDLLRLQRCFSLAPIHNPNSYSVLEVCLRTLPAVPEFAVFDTAFHRQLPAAARTYALPGALAAQYGLRKYGFHGLSYQYVSAQAAAWLGQPLAALKLIICHLGTGGSSLAALRGGHSIDTSMGYSPLPGLVMSTRSGDLDPEIVLELLRQGRSVAEVDQILNNQSGLLGLSGFSSNLEEIIAAAETGDQTCQLALDVYAHRLKLYLGAYTWLLNGADALIFTDDIGLRSWKLREMVCSQAENLGISLDREANRNAPIDRISAIHQPDSRTRLLVVPTDEEQVLLDEVLAAWRANEAGPV